MNELLATGPQDLSPQLHPTNASSRPVHPIPDFALTAILFILFQRGQRAYRHKLMDR